MIIGNDCTGTLDAQKAMSHKLKLKSAHGHMNLRQTQMTHLVQRQRPEFFEHVFS